MNRSIAVLKQLVLNEVLLHLSSEPVAFANKFLLFRSAVVFAVFVYQKLPAALCFLCKIYVTFKQITNELRERYKTRSLYSWSTRPYGIPYPDSFLRKILHQTRDYCNEKVENYCKAQSFKLMYVHLQTNPFSIFEDVTQFGVIIMSRMVVQEVWLVVLCHINATLENLVHYTVQLS